MLYLTLFGQRKYVKIRVSHVRYVLQIFKIWVVVAGMIMVSRLFNISIWSTVKVYVEYRRDVEQFS